jgi:hypothetical protein
MITKEELNLKQDGVSLVLLKLRKKSYSIQVVME